MAKRSANWTTEEEMVLIEEVGLREDSLFGKMKGDGVIKIGEIRSNGWQAIAEVLNARFSIKKRDPQEIKKKYYNIKQRSTDKLDQIKKPKTGGGPCINMTAAEELFLSNMSGRPQIEGLTCGIDTDASVETTNLTTKEATLHTERMSQVTQADVVCRENDSESVPQSTTSTCTSTLAEKRVERPKKVDTRKRRCLVDLEEENLKLDNQRLRMEIEKLQTEKEMIHLKKEILQLKKSKLEYEIQANFPFFTSATENHAEY